jgi:ubiquinone/menaquinone biosynthesis C-methylase UbiE
MKSQNQKKVWDKIAPEWHKFKTKPFGKVMEFLKGQKGKILDLGCGSGRHLANIKKGKMYLVDFSKEMINLAKKKAKTENIEAEFKVADSVKIPYSENFFNSAICIALLHCMSKKDAEKTLKELYRVLKPGAIAKISVWNKNSEWFNKKGKEITMKWRNSGCRYLYLYEPEEFYKLIEQTGFKIIFKLPPEKNIIVNVEKP